MSSKYAVYVRLNARQGKGGEVIEAFDSLYHGPLDEEPGTEIHILHQVKDDPDTLFFYELYTDEEANKAHAASSALAECLPKLAGLLKDRGELVFAHPVRAKGVSL